jgi:hypothetical protein
MVASRDVEFAAYAAGEFVRMVWKQNVQTLSVSERRWKSLPGLSYSS